MKKLLTTLSLIFIVALTLTSCSKEEFDPYDGTSHVIENILPGDWKFDGTQYYLSFDFPEIDEGIYQDGDVRASISFDDDIDGDYYHVVPAVIGNHSFNVKYGIGSLIVTADFTDPERSPVPPEALYMKIIITRAEIGLLL